MKTHISKHTIQVALAALWLFDGLLQLQRHMFTSDFANNVLTPAGDGQPGIVSGPVHFAVRITLAHPLLMNILYAGTQLLIGVLIVYRPTVRIGLWASLVWAMLVWWLGEGLGGVLGGQTSLWLGFPGAALLYALLSLAIMPSSRPTKDTDRQPAYWLPVAWAVVWIGGAIYQLLPSQSSTMLASTIGSMSSSSAPIWLANLNAHASNFLLNRQSSFVVMLAVLELIIGAVVLMPGLYRKLAIAGGIILSLIFWVIGQSFGMFFSGLATDPGTAPLIILLGIAILGCTDVEPKLLLQTCWHKLEAKLI